MTLSDARAGTRVVVRKQAVPFSYWPMRKTNRRWGLHSMVYATDPWPVISASLRHQCSASTLPSAESFVRQAREYFRAAENATAIETKPVLYYYSFLNLAKAFALARGQAALVGAVQHGLSDRGAASSLAAAEVLAFKSTSTKTNAFYELHEALGWDPSAFPSIMRVGELMSQILVGHRLWREASGGRERFIQVEEVHLLHDAKKRQLWGAIDLTAAAIRRRSRSFANIRDEGGMASDWVVAQPPDASMRRFEQKSPVTYGHRSSDNVMDVIDSLRPVLWRTITSTEPYRRYYLYLSPPSEVRLDQLLSTYALMYYLGSLTRYRPLELLSAIDGPYGEFLHEFLAAQPQQFVFAIASEFLQREVSRAGVV
jgi:hypothetical protein